MTGEAVVGAVGSASARTLLKCIKFQAHDAQTNHLREFLTVYCGGHNKIRGQCVLEWSFQEFRANTIWYLTTDYAGCKSPLANGIHSVIYCAQQSSQVVQHCCWVCLTDCLCALDLFWDLLMLLRDCWKDGCHHEISCLGMKAVLIPWQIFDRLCICSKVHLMLFLVLELPKSRIDTSLPRSIPSLCLWESLFRFFLCISSGATSQRSQSTSCFALLMHVYSADSEGSACAVMRRYLNFKWIRKTW